MELFSQPTGGASHVVRKRYGLVMAHVRQLIYNALDPGAPDLKVRSPQFPDLSILTEAVIVYVISYFLLQLWA